MDRKIRPFVCDCLAFDQGCPACLEESIRTVTDTEEQMTGPAKNRLHDYEAGWLTLLVEMGVATKQEAHDAMCRIAQAA